MTARGTTQWRSRLASNSRSKAGAARKVANRNRDVRPLAKTVADQVGDSLDIAAATAILLVVIVVGAITYGLVWAAKNYGWFRPEAQTIGDARIAGDYRSGTAFSGMAQNTRKVVISTQGEGLQIFEKNSGALGVWQAKTKVSTNEALPNDNVENLASLGENFLVASGGQLLMTSEDLNQWSALTGMGVFQNINSAVDLSYAAFAEDGTHLLVGTHSDGLGIYDTAYHRWSLVKWSTQKEDDPLASVNFAKTAPGELWIGTPKGLTVVELDTANAAWVTNRHRSSMELTGVDIVDVAFSASGVTALSRKGGVFFMPLNTQGQSSGTWQTVIAEEGFTNVGAGNVNSIAWWDSRIWAAAGYNGVGVYTPQTRQWSVTKFAADRDRPGFAYQLVEYQGKLCLATSAGIYSYDNTAAQWAYMDGSPSAVIARLRPAGENLWYVTNGGESGVYRGAEQRWQTFTGAGIPGYGTPQINTLVLFHDQVWAGLESGGVAVYAPDQHTWTIKNSGFSASVDAAIKVIDLRVFGGNLYARVQTPVTKDSNTIPHQGVYYWNGGQWSAISRADEEITAMKFDGSAVWLLNDAGEVRNSGTGQKYFAGTFGADAPEAISQAGDLLYLGSRGGISAYDTARHNHETLVSKAWVTDLSAVPGLVGYVTKNGEVGTYFSATNQNIVQRSVQEVAVNSPSVTTFQVFDGLIWFGTSQGMVYRFDGRTQKAELITLPIDSSNPAFVKELMVGGDTLWCRVTYNNGLNGVFAYPRGGLEWKRVSDSIEDVTRMVYAGGSLWYLNAGSELRVVDPQAYSARTVLFGGTFLGLSSAKDVQVDQFGRLWFISPQYGAGIYDPAMRRWQTFDTQGGYGLQILRQGSSDEIYVSGASKIYQFVSSVGGITAAGEFPFLNSLSGSQFYAQSNQIWGVQGIGRDYFTISRLTLPVPEKTDASTLWTTQLAHQNSTSQRLKADSALMAGNRIWFLDEAGKAFFFDLASEQWQGLRMDSNQTFSMLSKDPSGNVWAAGENRDVLNSLSWGIYQLVEKDSAFSIENTYLMPAPVHSFTPGGNGMVASLTSGATQVISWEGDKFNNAKIITVMGPGAVVDLPYSPEVSLRFGVIASAIVLGVTLLVIWINNFQKFRMRNIMERIRYGLPSERWGIALIVEVGVMLILWSIYLFSRMQLSELKKIDRISNEIRSVAASQGSLWVASHTGLWRLSEQGAIQEYEAVGDALPEGQIERLFKYNNELYLQMASGNYYQAQCSVLGCKWEKLSAEPLQPIIYQDSRWMWTHSGVAVQVQIKDQQGISHRLPLERARFDYLAVNDVLFSAGRFWIATNGGVAEYQAQIDGQVTLDRLYDEQDGLPASPVKSCLEAENTIICRAGGQDWRFETEQKRWARYSGPSPFEAVHEVVYNDALTGLYVQRMPQGVIFGPDAIIGGPISLYQRFSSDQAVTLAAKDDQIYIKTPVGVWQAEAEAGGALALRQFAISGLDAPFVTSPTVTIDPPGDFWRWSYRHNPQTGEDSVKITLASDGSVPRFLLGGGTFGDHFTEQIVLQSSERGTLAWLGTQQGIWRGTIATHSIDMVLENYYSVGGHSITSLWMEGEALYAQDENGQVFHYDPGPDNWSSADHLKPINYRSYELPIMGLLAIEGDPPYLPPVLFNNRYSFDRITDFAVSGDMLWTVTPDGVFAFQVSAEGLTARVKYQPAQGLYPSSARFIEIDEAGRPVILTDLLQYQRLEGVEFLPLNSVKDTPFDSNRLLISGAGMADWHSRDGRITAELNGVEVPFVQGKLAFDVVRDILPVRDEVWAVTEMGIGPLRFRYGAALVYEKAANETGLSSSITELDSEDEWVYGRLESGTFVRWDGNTWVELPASGISSGESLPFQTPVALYNQRQWQVVNRTYQDGIDRFEIQGLPKERIFDANGRLATDSVLAVGSNGNATWLVTPLGVQQFQTSPAQIEAEYLVDNQFGEYSILAGIVSEGKLYVQRQDGAIFQLRLEDSSHLQRIEGGQELFAPYRFVFKEGRWQQQMVEGNGLRTWLAVDGAKEDYSLFTSDGRFPFDVVHAVLPDGEGLWLGTEGGLAIAQIPTFGKPLVYRSLVGLPSSYSFAPVTWLDRRNGGIACQVQTVGGVNVKFRDCLNALPESTGAEILPELHLTLPRGREEITLKVESDTGLVFMQRGTAVRSIQHTDNRLEFLTDQDALTSPVFMLPNGERVWVLTSHALVMLNLAEIEKHIVP